MALLPGTYNANFIEPSIMKTLIKKEPVGSYQYTDIDIPNPGDGEVLIKVLLVSMCGSDISLYKWDKTATSIASLPFIPGHECVGEIVKLGEGCPTQFNVGSRVCCENHFFCGRCYQCQHDQQHICQNLNQYGHGKGTIHGGCSQYSIIPAKYCYLLKTGLDNDRACLLEPFGVAQHATEELNASGDTVLVQGCGPIGLMAIGILKACGVKKILAVDIIQDRLERAKVMGADVIIDGSQENLNAIVFKETNEDGVGRILEVSGSTVLIQESFSRLRKGGVIVMVGIPKGTLQIAEAAKNILFKSLHLKSIHGRKIFSTWEKSEHLLYSNVVDVNSVITHRFPMSQFEEAFKVLLSGNCCKILLDPQK